MSDGLQHYVQLVSFYPKSTLVSMATKYVLGERDYALHDPKLSNDCFFPE